MEMLVSIRISELKKAVTNGEDSKIDALVNEIRRIKNNELTNRLVKLILDGNGIVNRRDITEEIDDEEKYNFFNPKALINDFIKNKKIKKGISFVTVCMNRDQNLLKALPTWLETEVDEVIIVDWSSSENLAEKILKFNDPRITVIQIDGEEKWILTHAFNVGLKMACREIIYKLDSDILVSKNFITKNKIYENEFTRGFWKNATDAGEESQKYVNGTLGAFNQRLKNIGYYDERIMTYGWDDSDIYYRLANVEGLVGKYIQYSTIFHQDQDQDERIKYQNLSNKKKFLGKFEITELENSKNKFKSYFRDLWVSNYPQQDYELHLVNKNLLIGNRKTNHIETLSEDLFYSEMFATREFLGWIHSDFHKIRFDALRSLQFAKLMNELIRDNNEIKFKEGVNNNKNIKIFYCENNDLIETAKITISNIIRNIEPNDLPIILVSSCNVDLTTKSIPNIYLVNQNLASAIHEGLSDTVTECSFFDCVDSLNDSSQIVRLTCYSLVMSCWHFKDSVQSSIGKYSLISNEQRFKLTISLYDEKNLYRLRDYLTCLLINLPIFEFIEIYYESTNGVLVSLLSKLIVGDNSKKVSIKFWDKRPTYTDLFEENTSKTDHYVSVIANADVFFDESLSYINSSDLQNTVLAVSRRDIYKKDGQYRSKLIKYPNGAPNILSADAWITPSDIKLPRLDYQLGTIHCDSFFCNAILTRSELKIINPALDLMVFHLHDERFNSSEEKQKRDANSIELKVEVEKAANSGVNPVSGVSWCSIKEYNRFKLSTLQRWRPNSIVLVVKSDTHIILLMIIAHHLSEYLKKETDIMVILNIAEVKSKILIERFLGFINKENLQIDLEFDNSLQICNCCFQDFIELIQEKNSITFTNYLRHQYSGSRSVMNSLCIQLDSTELQQVSALNFFLNCQIYNSKKVLDQYFESIKDNNYELSNYLPYKSDYQYLGVKTKSLASGKPKISYVTSMFNASAYLPSFLENIHSAAFNADGEIILIDVNKHNQDEKIVLKYIKDNNLSKNFIRYIRLDHDPGLYKTWEHGINLSNSEIITNANIDDKRSASHTRVLTEFLLNNKEYAGACGSIWGSQEGPNERYSSIVNGEIWFYDNKKFDIEFSDLWVMDGDLVKSRNIMHCIPVWRKKLHEKYGFFDEETYGTSADWAFWLKCAKGGEIYRHISDVFGRYYINPNSHNRINDTSGSKELRIINDIIEYKQEKLVKQ